MTFRALVTPGAQVCRHPRAGAAWRAGAKVGGSLSRGRGQRSCWELAPGAGQGISRGRSVPQFCVAFVVAVLRAGTGSPARPGGPPLMCCEDAGLSPPRLETLGVSRRSISLGKTGSYGASTKRIVYACVRGCQKIYKNNNRRKLTLTFTLTFTDSLSQEGKH